jgi:hypothetical protein
MKNEKRHPLHIKAGDKTQPAEPGPGQHSPAQERVGASDKAKDKGTTPSADPSKE